jgi:hypothetical protein
VSILLREHPACAIISRRLDGNPAGERAGTEKQILLSSSRECNRLVAEARYASAPAELRKGLS